MRIIDSKLCILHIIVAVVCIFSQPSLSEAQINVAQRRLKRSGDDPGEDVSAVIVMDFAVSAKTHWDQEIEFVVKFANHYKKARIGVVVIDCPSRTVFQMGTYSEEEIRSKITTPTNPVYPKGMAQSFELAKSLLSSETRSQKLLVLLSNGEELPKCTVGAPSKDRFELADEIRGMGVYIICAYLTIPKFDDIIRITGSDDLTRPLHFNKFLQLHRNILAGEIVTKAPQQVPTTTNSSPTTKSSTTTKSTTTAKTTSTTESPTTTRSTTMTKLTTTIESTSPTKITTTIESTSPTKSATTMKNTSPTESATTIKNTSPPKIATTTESAATTKSTTASKAIPTIDNAAVTIPGLGTGDDVSVVVIADFTKASQSKWDAEIRVLMKFANSVEKARIGVIGLGCPSTTILPMGIHSESEIRSKVTAPENPATEKGLAQAFDIARTLLSTEGGRRNIIFVMADGHDTCSVAKPAQPASEIEKELQKSGVAIGYLSFGGANNKTGAGDSQLSDGDFENLLETIKMILNAGIATVAPIQKTEATISVSPPEKTISPDDVTFPGNEFGDDVSVIVINPTESSQKKSDAAR